MCLAVAFGMKDQADLKRAIESLYCVRDGFANLYKSGVVASSLVRVVGASVVRVRSGLGHGSLVETCSFRAGQSGRSSVRAGVSGSHAHGSGLDTVLTVLLLLLGGLTRVVSVVVVDTVNGVRSSGAVGDALFSGKLLVLNHGSVLAETLLSAPVCGPEIHEVGQEVNVEQESNGPLANGSCRDDLVAPVVAWVSITSANTVADDESDRTRDSQRENDRLDNGNNLERCQTIMIVRKGEDLEHLEEH